MSTISANSDVRKEETSPEPKVADPSSADYNSRLHFFLRRSSKRWHKCGAPSITRHIEGATVAWAELRLRPQGWFRFRFNELSPSGLPCSTSIVIFERSRLPLCGINVPNLDSFLPQRARTCFPFLCRHPWQQNPNPESRSPLLEKLRG